MSRLPDNELIMLVDGWLLEAEEPIKQVSNNDDLLQYAAFGVATLLGYKIVKQLTNHFKEEAKATEKMMKAVYPKLVGSFPMSEAIATKLATTAMDGVLWSDRIWSDMDELRADLTKTMSNSLLKHEGPTKMTSEIRKSYSTKRYQAERILRTESARIMSTEQLDNMDKMGYDHVSWVASATACADCLAMNGRIFTLKQAAYMQPAHPNCRCAWSAYVE
jgi:SPP1 gp7 family putative phage head morphogenesis protein